MVTWKTVFLVPGATLEGAGVGCLVGIAGGLLLEAALQEGFKITINANVCSAIGSVIGGLITAFLALTAARPAKPRSPGPAATKSLSE